MGAYLAVCPEAHACIWLTPDEIRQAARLYATSKPACIAEGNGFDMNADVIGNVQAICMLRALSANLDIKGGDVSPQKVQTRDMTLKDTLDSKLKPITWEYPLFNNFTKGGGSSVNTVVPDAILNETPYPIKALIIQASNPIDNDNKFTTHGKGIEKSGVSCGD